jgi:hypothetical protein
VVVQNTKDKVCEPSKERHKREHGQYNTGTRGVPEGREKKNAGCFVT